MEGWIVGLSSERRHPSVLGKRRGSTTSNSVTWMWMKPLQGKQSSLNIPQEQKCWQKHIFLNPTTVNEKRFSLFSYLVRKPCLHINIVGNSNIDSKLYKQKCWHKDIGHWFPIEWKWSSFVWFNLWRGWHNRVHINKAVSCIPTWQGVSVWLLIRNSGFLPQSKDSSTGFTGDKIDSK